MANTKGLGKGLSALLGDDVIAAKDERASSLLLPISQVESCSTQPRKSFDPEALSDLADSIRVHGIIQPLTVRKLQSGYYQIIAGERRWRAARMAGLTQVPVVVIEADDRKAMELAIEALSLSPDYALIDGNRDHGRCASIDLPHETVVGGDGRSISIAAASILAKVTRDRYVTEVLDKEYPQYHFAQHKGYGTKRHYEALREFGPSPIHSPCPEHRQSFLKKWKERQS